VIPASSELVGWAAVDGNGVATTTGGGDLAPVVVTTLQDFQLAVFDDLPRVVRVQGVLPAGDTAIGSNKTIIGTCGAQIGGHIEISESQNIIFRNITIVGFSVGDCALDPGFDPAEGCSSGDDAISVQRNSHHVWFDHVAVRDGSDGNLDVSNAANFITISWSKFSYTPRVDALGSDATGASGHRYSNLVGGTDTPTTFDDANTLNVTWHHNWWADNVVERQPRIRFGQNHLFNNYWSSDVTNYCVRSGIQAQILLEGNVFDGVETPHEFNNAADQLTSNITAGPTNLYQATTGEMAVGGEGPAFTDPPYDYELEPAAGIAAAVTAAAGPQ
jgi:pectate lyase